MRYAVLSLALFTAATSAAAQDAPRVTDQDYTQLTRCAAIERVARAGDTFRDAARAQARDRTTAARWEAGQAEDRAVASYEAGDRRQRRALEAELQGGCRALLSGEARYSAN